MIHVCLNVQAETTPLQPQIKLFWLVAFAFLAGIYANMKTLQYANVDT